MEEQQTTKRKVVGGLFWSFGERICAQLVTLIVGIILARILSPDDYGVISIVMVFISICDVFVTGGFGTALVQKQEADKSDYNTAFYMSFGMSVVLYIILFFAAPYIALFYQRDILTNIIRVLGVRLIITSLNTVQQAHLQREMKFRKFFIATIFGTVISCAAGIIMAYCGFGVWALVSQYLTNSFIDTIVLCFVGGWNPGIKTSKKKAKEIYSFGWKVLCTNLIATSENSIRSLLVGKNFGPEDLAYYDQGRKYPALLVDNVNTTIQKVMLPTFSRMQDDKVEMKRALRRCIKLETFLLAPFLIGFAAIAQIFVPVVLTDKWTFAIPFIWVFCANYLTRPIESSCNQALLALGKSGLVFGIMAVINVASIILSLLAIFVLKSVLWVALFSLLSTFISVLCFLLFTKKLINYSFREQLADMLPSLAIAFVMGGIVYGIGYIPMNEIALLVLQVFCGILVYLLLCLITKIEPYRYLISSIKSKLKIHKKDKQGLSVASDNSGIETKQESNEVDTYENDDKR